jgi:acetyltransferase-like isoleucine patch superfamily enzyme
MERIILYGAGAECRNWIKKLPDGLVWKIADSNSGFSGGNIDNIPIISLAELMQIEGEYSIFPAVSAKYYDEILEVLEKAGLRDRIIQSPYDADTLYMRSDARIDSYSFFAGANYLGKNVYISKSDIGYASYVSDNTVLDNVKIGKYSAIAADVSIIKGRHPSNCAVSIHPAFYSPDNDVARVSYVSENRFEEYKYTPDGFSVEIGNDVWIGQGVHIMEGVTISDGAIIGAGSLVLKDVPPYTVYGGVPAKMIRHRFTTEQIDFLIKLKWWDKGEDWIKKYAEYFDNVEELMARVSSARA